MQKDVEGLVIPQDWTFENTSVAQNFSRHVNEQLPFYSLATNMVAHIGRHYLPENGVMYDLGASTGNITLALRHEIETRNVVALSIDKSHAMAEVWNGVGSFETGDVTQMEYGRYDFCVCFLLFMFLPPMQQRPLFEKLYASLNPGGALVIFDKTADFDGYLGTVMHRLALAGKLAGGATGDEIVQKELSLAGAQRPIDPSQMLFLNHRVREVFRFGEFCGWVATK